MSLYIQEHIVKNEEKRLFIVHGICEHSGRYENTINHLNENKISVISYDLRGHGQSAGKKGYIKYFSNHVDDLKFIVNKYKNSNVQNYLLGHSMGGLIGHLYMIDSPEVDGYVAIGAPTNIIKDVKPLLITGYRWFGFLKKKNKFANNSLSHDAEVEKAYQEDPLVLKEFYIRLAGEMFVRGVKHLNKNIEKHTKPILMLHGSDDKIVPKEHTLRLYDLINHENKNKIIYDNMYHEILNEINNVIVIKNILEWLNEQ